MSRSPLAYPLNRSADLDSGGAADLQTDIMRFMAILSLCLVAIFALVQSLPMTPAAALEETKEIEAPPPMPEALAVNENRPVEMQEAVQPILTKQAEPVAPPVPPEKVTTDEIQPAAVVVPAEVVSNSPPAIAGFSLRFESDIALMRLVANRTIGVYAIDVQRARRMTVADSRISFWDSPTPNKFHEMDATTVPEPVMQALQNSGGDASENTWGVTLPENLSEQLADIMSRHSGGALIINIDGSIHREAS